MRSTKPKLAAQAVQAPPDYTKQPVKWNIEFPKVDIAKIGLDKVDPAQYNIERIVQAMARHYALLDSKNALWTIADLAWYLRTTVRGAEAYFKTPGFPKPIRLPRKSEGKSHRRWIAAQVREWALLCPKEEDD